MEGKCQKQPLSENTYRIACKLNPTPVMGLHGGLERTVLPGAEAG